MKKIVFAASEVVPFAKTGGLADVVGALPKALKKAGHDVCVFMPKYSSINKKQYGLKTLLKRVRLRLGKGTKEFNIFSSFLPGSDVPVYFIDKELYFNTKELYQEKGVDYANNAERFHYFSLAVLEALKVLDIKADIIHCHDWQTAMIPLYLKLKLQDDPFYKDMKTIYTIHNLAYHGLFEKSCLDFFGIDEDLFTPEKLEFWGKVNFSKGGLVYSDLITTVSEKYSQEIQSEEFGCGLDGLLKYRASDLTGIVNGLDYSIWNPETDNKIAKNFSVDDLSGKEENKKKLLEMNGLPYKQGVPVIGLISRLTVQKGFDILEPIINKVLEMEIRFVLLGTGDPKYQDLFTKLEKQFPDKIKANLKFDAQLAQLIYAGSDMFLMPSHYEPCGLGQLISLKYGTVPIVRLTGGLADTIHDADRDIQIGNGFTFEHYTEEALLQTMYRAVDSYYNYKEKWHRIQSNGMKEDYSWEHSAKEYSKFYEEAAKKKVVFKSAKKLAMA